VIRILNVEPKSYSSEARAILRRIGTVVERECGRRDLLAEVGRFHVLITRLAHDIDADVLRRAQRLRCIVSATTGLDHIDVDEADRRGIRILSLRGEVAFLRTISSTAEHTWGLLLAVARRTPQAFASVLNGGWDRDPFRGCELSGKRLGIVGLGRIGTKVAGYGRVFGMRVAGYDPFRRSWPSGVARARSLDALLTRSDVLTLHVPLAAETRGMIGSRELRRLPRGSILLNSARGQLVEEAALARALETGHLSGVALDVLERERDPSSRRRSPLLEYARTHQNLIITPHLGGATIEAMARSEVHLARRLHDCFR
jgi:D-3-phosphoglycerate dehydrogenase